ncbi:hypothetical protein JTB14_026054 [Gonioctena quinquepunctata]|nr:hypothetical protein JTB14_026054 [Gonioctena quinquepunctata]
MLTLALWTLLVVFASLYIFIRPLWYWKIKQVIQISSIPIFGDYLRTTLRFETFPEALQRLYNQFSNERYCRIYQFATPTLLIRDPELIKEVTIRDFDHFTDHRSFVTKTSDPLWGKNVFSLKGQKWREMRSILSPAFTSRKMKFMFGLIAECAEDFVSFFLETDQDVIEVELKDTFNRFSNDAIATFAFGIKVDSLKEPKNEFFLKTEDSFTFTAWKSMKLFLSLMLPTFMMNLLKLRIFDQNISDFFRDIVDETIKIREQKGIVRPDLIHLMMEARKYSYKNEEDSGYSSVKESDIGKQTRHKLEITNADIAAQALVFFLGGFESSSSLMCFVGYELAVNEHTQKRLRKEIEETLDECDGVITYDALLKMKYMDMVISGIKGVMNSIPLKKLLPLDADSWSKYDNFHENSDKNFEVEDHLDEDISQQYNLSANDNSHAEPRYPKRQHPDCFDPDRFSDENRGRIDPYTYLPFGIGPRKCIGSRFAILETKMLLFHLLSKFELIPTPRSTIPFEISRGTFTLDSGDGFWFAFKRLTDR